MMCVKYMFKTTLIRDIFIKTTKSNGIILKERVVVLSALNFIYRLFPSSAIIFGR